MKPIEWHTHALTHACPGCNPQIGRLPRMEDDDDEKTRRPPLNLEAYYRRGEDRHRSDHQKLVTISMKSPCTAVGHRAGGDLNLQLCPPSLNTRFAGRIRLSSRYHVLPQ